MPTFVLILFFMKRFFFFAVIVFLSASAYSQSRLVDVQAFDSLRNLPQMQKVDLRTGAEFEVIQSFDDFISLNCVKKNFLPLAEKKLDKTKPLLVYCMSGHRSADAVKQLKNVGFNEIYELKGGLIHYYTTKKEKGKN